MEEKAPSKSQGYQKKVVKETGPEKQREHKQVDYSSPLAKKWPRMIEALEQGNAEVVKQLIEEGLNVNVLREGGTPLMTASSHGHAGVVEVLLQAGVNVNEKDDAGWTALHKAAHGQKGTAVIDLLVEAGIDIDARNKSKKTALDLAGERGNREIVLRLQRHRQQSDTDSREWEAFLNSHEGRPYKRQRQHDVLAPYARFWWLPVIALGICGFAAGTAFGAMIIATVVGLVLGLLAGGGIFLRLATLRKHLDEIGPLPELDIHRLREKIKAGESIDVVQMRAAEEAEQGEITEPNTGKKHAATRFSGPAGQGMALEPRLIAATAAVIMLLLLLGGTWFLRGNIKHWYYARQLEKQGISATPEAFLERAAKNDGQAMDLFLKAGMPLDAQDDQGRTALAVAAGEGNAELAGKLCGLGPSLVNLRDKSGATPLMAAARKGSEQTVSALLACGAEINAMAPEGEGAATALQAVLDAPELSEGGLKVMQTLLQKGADVTGKDASGRSPLLFAVERGHADAVKLLLERGADANDSDRAGMFPLMAASCAGRADLVAILAGSGADMKKALPDGRTPLMCAAREGRADVITQLVEKGVHVNEKAPDGSTALAAAIEAGNLDVIRVLLVRGADPRGIAFPAAFLSFKGQFVAPGPRTARLGDVMKRIAAAAARDGYAIKPDPLAGNTVVASARGPWNEVLAGFAGKHSLLIVMKEKEVHILPYDPARIRRD